MTVELTVAPEGDRPGLRLRPWAGPDAESLARAHEDPAMRRWLTTRLDGAEAARRWIDAEAQGWAGGVRYSFAVLTEGGTAPVGHVVVKRKRAGDPSAEVGYWTAAAARGRGVAPRAVRAVADWALSGGVTAPFDRLELLHAVDNTASCRVAEKCGFPLDSLLDPHPPKFPTAGHVHARTRPAG